EREGRRRLAAGCRAGGGAEIRRPGRERARQGGEDRARHHHRVLRLPVPVLRPRAIDAEAGAGPVSRKSAPGVEEPAALLPVERDARRRGGHGRVRAGQRQVLGDARPAFRETAGTVARLLRAGRQGDRARRGEVEGVGGIPQWSGPDPGGHERRQRRGRERDSHLLHQRQAAGRGHAVRVVQAGDRRGVVLQGREEVTFALVATFPPPWSSPPRSSTPAPATTKDWRIRSLKRGDREGALRLLASEGWRVPAQDQERVLAWVVQHPELESFVAHDSLSYTRLWAMITMSHRPQLRLGGRVASIDL